METTKEKITKIIRMETNAGLEFDEIADQILELFAHQTQEFKQIVLEDVPHEYQNRLLEKLDQIA